MARSILIPDTPSVASGQMTKVTLPELLKIADTRKIRVLVETLRQVTNMGWREDSVHPNGGTLRYWIASPDGRDRVLFGMNVGGNKFKTPEGALDVWIWPETAAEYSGFSIEDIWDQLEEFKSLRASNKRFVTRIKDDAEALKFYNLLAKWDSTNAELRAKREAEERESQN